MPIHKIKKDNNISRNILCKLLDEPNYVLKWIDNNFNNNKYIIYEENLALIFNVSLSYIHQMTPFELLSKAERNYLITKYHVDEKKLIEFQNTYLNKYYLDYLYNSNIKIKEKDSLEIIINFRKECCHEKQINYQNMEK